MEDHFQKKFDHMEAKVKKAFAAIKQDIQRIEKAKKPEMTVTPVDYKLRTDFMAFRNSILQEIDFIKESVMSIKQYGMSSDVDSMGDASSEEQAHLEATEELAELREDIRDLSEIVVKKQKRYEQILNEVKDRLDVLESKKK